MLATSAMSFRFVIWTFHCIERLLAHVICASVNCDPMMPSSLPLQLLYLQSSPVHSWSITIRTDMLTS